MTNTVQQFLADNFYKNEFVYIFNDEICATYVFNNIYCMIKIVDHDKNIYVYSKKNYNFCGIKRIPIRITYEEILTRITYMKMLQPVSYVIGIRTEFSEQSFRQVSEQEYFNYIRSST